MKKKALRILLPVLMLLSLFSAAPAARAATIKISDKKVTLLVGQTKTLKITGTKKTVSWKVGNEKIAKISKKGQIRAKRVGRTTITAKVAGKKLTCKLTVDKNPKLSANPSVSSIRAGNTLKLSVIGCTSKPKVKWSSSNEKIASINSKGEVKAKRPGKVTLTAKVLRKTLKRTLTVTEASRDAWEITDTCLYYEQDWDSVGTSLWPVTDVIAWYGIVEVKNTGNTSLELFDCTMKVVDQNGTVMDTISKDTYNLYCFPKLIGPGEKGYFYGHSTFELPETEKTYKLQASGLSIEHDRGYRPKLTITKASRTEDTDREGRSFPEITYTVGNPNSIAIRDIQSGVLFYNAAGKVIGVDGKDGSYYVFTLSPGHSSEHTKGGAYGVLSPGCTSDKVKSYKIIARCLD